jgi:hypothetical protein
VSSYTSILVLVLVTVFVIPTHSLPPPFVSFLHCLSSRPPHHWHGLHDRARSDSGVCVCHRVCMFLPPRGWAEICYSHLTVPQQRTSDGIIDQRVFQGIVDLNDIDSTDFSTQMVHTYLAVATSTLADMDRAVCVTLHFLPPLMCAPSSENRYLPFYPSLPASPSYYLTDLLVRKVFFLTCYVPTGGTRTSPNYLYWPSRYRTRRMR